MFSGGNESNSFLENLGFEIVAIPSRPIEYPVESYSWKAISNTVAIKILDKSAFLHHGSGVPRDFKLFFDLDELAYDNQVNITLIHKGQSFKAHFQIDKPLERIRLFWRSDFSELLKESLPDWHNVFAQNLKSETERPEMRLFRVSDSEYQVDLIQPADIILDVESEVAEGTIERSEGATKYSYSKRYERDPENRKKANEIHGCVCCVCGFVLSISMESVPKAS